MTHDSRKDTNSTFCLNILSKRNIYSNNEEPDQNDKITNIRYILRTCDTILCSANKLGEKRRRLRRIMFLVGIAYKQTNCLFRRLLSLLYSIRDL